jgi:hypothetical protein
MDRLVCDVERHRDFSKLKAVEMLARGQLY